MKKNFCFLIMIFCLFGKYVNADDLTWQMCVNEALQNNQQIAQAKAKLEQSKANAWTAKSSVFPQLSVSAGASRGGNEFQSLTSDPTSYSYGASVRQSLFNGFQTINDINKSNEEINVAELNYKITSADIRYKLRQAYVNLMKAQELLSMTEDILTRRKKQYLDIKMRYNAGREHKGSLLNAEASFAQAGFEQEQSKRNFLVAQQLLAKELGRTDYADLKVQTDFNLMTDLSQRIDFNELLKKNYNYVTLEKKKKMAEYSAASSIGAFFPSINLSGSVSQRGEEIPIDDGANWSAGINLSLSILDGGLLMAKKNAADAYLKQTEKELEYGKNDVLLNMEQAWNNLADAMKNNEIQEKFLSAAYERAKIADAQYSNGLVTFDNWTIIQDNLVSSKKSYLNSQANLLLSEAAWIQITGGTLEDEKK
ncbi:MAG TPA: TolC family protein [Candidatus Goldiibacteriota bacterium]|nr:TolC family protein [Candidatus Goldiibacteriota bacterium]